MDLEYSAKQSELKKSSHSWPESQKGEYLQDATLAP